MRREPGLIEGLRRSSFLRHNAVFFFGSTAVGVLNYAFYPVVGRLLSLSDYGTVQALVSIFTQLAVFLTVLALITINIVANYEDENEKKRVTLELEKLGLFVSIIVLIVGSIFSAKFKVFFHFNSVWPFRVMLLAFVVNVPLAFRNAFLRAHEKFGAISISGIIGSGTEIFIAAGLILIGFGAAGALGAIVIAQVLAFAYSAYRTRKIGFSRPKGSRYFDLPNWKTLAPEVKYSLFVFFLSLVITVLSSIDIVVVKHYFSPQVAGLYAGVSIIGRSIFFLTGPIAGVLLPLVRMHGQSKNNRALLMKSFGLLGLVGGGALLVFSLFPTTIISILMGHKYLVYAHLLPSLSLAMFLFSIVNMLIIYSIALRDYRISAIVAISLVMTGVLILTRHKTVGAVVDNLVYGGIATLVLFGIWHIYRTLRGRDHYAQP